MNSSIFVPSANTVTLTSANSFFGKLLRVYLIDVTALLPSLTCIVISEPFVRTFPASGSVATTRPSLLSLATVAFCVVKPCCSSEALAESNPIPTTSGTEALSVAGPSLTRSVIVVPISS